MLLIKNMQKRHFPVLYSLNSL